MKFLTGYFSIYGNIYFNQLPLNQNYIRLFGLRYFNDSYSMNAS